MRLITDMSNATGKWLPASDYGRPHVADLQHDAAYAHALVQAIKENDCDGWSGDAWPMQVVLSRAAEIMRGFGYDTDT